MIRYQLALPALVATFLATQALSQATAEDTGTTEAGIGGIALELCENVVGAQNAPVLAQAGDWGLGYMAGRIDAGEMLVEGTPLSASNSIDIVTSVALHCRDNPEDSVLDALRLYAETVFGTSPVTRSIEGAPPNAPRPMPRPPAQTPETTDEIPDPLPPATPDATEPTE